MTTENQKSDCFTCFTRNVSQRELRLRRYSEGAKKGRRRKERARMISERIKQIADRQADIGNPISRGRWNKVKLIPAEAK